MPTDAKSPGHVIGAQLRRLREERNLTQGDLVTSARRLGLTWTRPTVAAIETGRRELSVGEFLLLPIVVFDAAERALEWDDLVAAGQPLAQRLANAPTLRDLFPVDAWVQLAPAASFPGEAVGKMLVGETLDPSSARMDTPIARAAAELGKGIAALTKIQAKVWPDATVADDQGAYDDSGREVEQRTARRLGVSSFVASLAARRLWGHGITEERDKRLAGQTPGRSGHVTRGITEELRVFLAESGVINPRAKRASRKEG